MKSTIFLAAFAFCLFAPSVNIAQNILPPQQPHETLTVMFYNVENLFDTKNDSLKNDGEFTPEGAKEWDYYRYNEKLKGIYKVIMAVGEWNPPVIVGLAEVENKNALSALVNFTPLKKFGYRYVHEESDDRRGIDVALLYREDFFQYLHHQAFKVKLEGRPTRGILVVSGILREDTCHFLVNHWPSRIGGKIHTEDLRLQAAAALKYAVDSLSKAYCQPNIMAMGDFNDGPKDASIMYFANADYESACGRTFKMLNLMDSQPDGAGTLVHTDVFSNWYLFDQIIASEFFISQSGISANKIQASIFKAGWLLDKEASRLRRTYLGSYYQGGFSDHLPVYFRLYPGTPE